ncbi:MAG: redoxin domain-containing protein [Myxococcales bacterium]|nr:redoxin domain-containing protein [Myxococcales bacterium]
MSAAPIRSRAAGVLPLILALALPLVLGGCPPRSPPQPPPEEGAGADAAVIAPLPDPVAEPTNRAEGDVLVIAIPRLDGDPLDLRDLRGRVVIVELSATWADDWTERYALYDGLVREHGPERLAVVLVAMDGEREALTPEPALRGPGFELGWDPQGAVAAQLQAAAVPTVIVVDAEGRIAHALAADVTSSSIVDALSSTLAAP